MNYSNHVKPSLVPVQVEDFILESTELVLANLPENLTLTLSDVDQNWYVNGDTSQMTQVMVNVLKNAVNAIGKNNGKIHVKCELVNQYDLNQPNYKIQQFMPKDALTATAGLQVFTDQSIKISVQDNGPGMGQSIIKHLFDMFFTTNNASGGTGLGMYGVATIITDHLGGIKVYSKPNYGTYIELIIPSAQINQTETHLDSSKYVLDQSAPRNTNSQVLIIDDNQEVGLLISQILSREGIKTRFIDSAKEGLQLILMYPKKWSVIICDHKMPELQGLEILKLIRNNGITIPFILTSGYLDEIKSNDSIKLADHLLDKPIESGLLVSTVSQHLEQA